MYGSGETDVGSAAVWLLHNIITICKYTMHQAAGILHGGDYTSLCTTSALCRSVDFELEKVSLSAVTLIGMAYIDAILVK